MSAVVVVVLTLVGDVIVELCSCRNFVVVDCQIQIYTNLMRATIDDAVAVVAVYYW